VPVYRVLAQYQTLGDVWVAQSLRDELQHVELTRRQDRHGLSWSGDVRSAPVRTGALRRAARLYPLQSLLSHACQVEGAAGNRRLSLALLVIATAKLMVVFHATIVNVTLQTWSLVTRPSPRDHGQPA
jgi:hypothetical protein